MKPLTEPELEEVLNLVAEADLDQATRIAQAAELRELRKLHGILKRERSVSMRLARAIAVLPHEVGDTAAWKILVHDSLAAAQASTVSVGYVPDLINGGKEK